MNAIWKHALAAAGLAIAAQAGAQVTFYEHSGMRGQSFTADRPIGDLERFGFNNRASSAVVVGGPWEVCDGPGFSGRCVILRPGRHESLGAVGMNDGISSARPASGRNAPAYDPRYGSPPPADPRYGSPPPPNPRYGSSPPVVQAVFYEHPGFQGLSFTAERAVGNLERFGFHNRAASAIVVRGSWEVCDGPRFSGQCVVLPPGQHSSLSTMGLNVGASSARAVRRGQ
jgi:beta/gamma crystallin